MVSLTESRTVVICDIKLLIHVIIIILFRPSHDLSGLFQAATLGWEWGDTLYTLLGMLL